jgi:hypothetical protein
MERLVPLISLAVHPRLPLSLSLSLSLSQCLSLRRYYCVTDRSHDPPLFKTSALRSRERAPIDDATKIDKLLFSFAASIASPIFVHRYPFTDIRSPSKLLFLFPPPASPPTSPAPPWHKNNPTVVLRFLFLFLFLFLFKDKGLRSYRALGNLAPSRCPYFYSFICLLLSFFYLPRTTGCKQFASVTRQGRIHFSPLRSTNFAIIMYVFI